MKTLRATRLQTLHYLEIPAALPVFLGGLRVGATLSVIGAVVGEFVGANQGLGFLINVARGSMIPHWYLLPFLPSSFWR